MLGVKYESQLWAAEYLPTRRCQAIHSELPVWDGVLAMSFLFSVETPWRGPRDFRVPSRQP